MLRFFRFLLPAFALALAACASPQNEKVQEATVPVQAREQHKASPDLGPVQVVSAEDLDAFIHDLPPQTIRVSEQSLLTPANRRFLLIMALVMANRDKCEELQLDSIVTDQNASNAATKPRKTVVTKLSTPNAKDLFTGTLGPQPEEGYMVFERTEHWIYKGCGATKDVSVSYLELR